MLTSCGVYSKRIGDSTFFDLIMFLVITLIIGFFWYLIMATANDKIKKDNNKIKITNDTISKENEKEEGVEKKRREKEVKDWRKACDFWDKHFDCKSFRKDLQKILLTFENTKSVDQNNNKIDYRWSFLPSDLDIQDREKTLRFYIKNEIIELQLYWGIYGEKIEFHLNYYKLDPPNIFSKNSKKSNRALKEGIEAFEQGEDFDKAMNKSNDINGIGIRYNGENLEKTKTFDLDLFDNAKKNFIDEVLKRLKDKTVLTEKY